MHRVLTLLLISRLATAHVSDTPPVSTDLAFVPVTGHTAITKHQEALKKTPGDPMLLERLGRLFISHARLTHDESFYSNAEACGLLLGETAHGLLLRGHCLLAAHRFHDAEELARKLLKLRQDMQDHALLGDALMEQGLLDDALPVYQAMIDTKPCLPSYSRIAHFRWLKGDVAGAIEMAEQAIACGSYRDPEPLAWVTTRLAFYQWQSGDLTRALQTTERADELIRDYPHARFIAGRIHLAKNEHEVAAKALRTAVKALPLPDVLWALEEAEGKEFPSDLLMADPRSASLYLASRGKERELALDLAKQETIRRRDVFTWDALAWAQLRAGQTKAAVVSAQRALAEGTQDARLFLHAGIIFRDAGDATKATALLAQASKLSFQLLPSEQALLNQKYPSLASSNTK
jgi:tetratricopeptide (TPR) repeat protein